MVRLDTDVFQWIRNSERKLQQNKSILDYILQQSIISGGKSALRTSLGEDVFGERRPTFDELLLVIEAWLTTRNDFKETVTGACGESYLYSPEYRMHSLWWSFLVLMEIMKAGPIEREESTNDNS